MGVDDPYYPSAVRLVRGAGEPVDGDAYDPEEGTSMQQLLRARRRQTLFGGSGRVSHSQVQSLQPPPEPPPPTEDELLMAALLQRRDKRSAVPAAAAVGSTPNNVQQQPPTGAWTARHEQLLFDYRSRHRGLPNNFDEPRPLADATAATGSGNVSLAPASSVHAVADGGTAEDDADGAGARVHDGLSGLSHLRYLQPTEATETKATLRAQRRSALRGSTDAVLEPVERLLNALTPKPPLSLAALPFACRSSSTTRSSPCCSNVPLWSCVAASLDGACKISRRSRSRATRSCTAAVLP